MPPPPEQDAIAAAMQWVSRITTVAIEMVLPGMLGHWLDGRLGTSFLVLVGFGLGMILGFWHLLKMTQSSSERDDKPRGRKGPPSGSR